MTGEGGGQILTLHFSDLVPGMSSAPVMNSWPSAGISHVVRPLLEWVTTMTALPPSVYRWLPKWTGTNTPLLHTQHTEHAQAKSSYIETFFRWKTQLVEWGISSQNLEAAVSVWPRETLCLAPFLFKDSHMTLLWRGLTDPLPKRSLVIWLWDFSFDIWALFQLYWAGDRSTISNNNLLESSVFM